MMKWSLDGRPLPAPRMKLGRGEIRTGQGCFENPQEICQESSVAIPTGLVWGHPHTGRSLNARTPACCPHGQDAALTLDRLKDFWR